MAYLKIDRDRSASKEKQDVSVSAAGGKETLHREERMSTQVPTSLNIYI